MDPLYDASDYRVRPELVSAHASVWCRLASPGASWTGAQRLEIARVARGAANGVADDATSDHEVSQRLPANLIAMIEIIAADPKSLGRAHFQRLVPAVLSEAAYVEMVAVVAQIVNLDVFTRGIDTEPAAIPIANDGERTLDYPSSAVDEGAWVSTVPSGIRGGEDAQRIYPAGFMANILRATSLAMNDARSIIDVMMAQYNVPEKAQDLSYVITPSLDKMQTELVAARVSALNECFY